LPLGGQPAPRGTPRLVLYPGKPGARAMLAIPPPSRATTHARCQYLSKIAIQKEVSVPDNQRLHVQRAVVVPDRGDGGRGGRRLASAALRAAMRGRARTFQGPPRSAIAAAQGEFSERIMTRTSRMSSGRRARQASSAILTVSLAFNRCILIRSSRGFARATASRDAGRPRNNGELIVGRRGSSHGVSILGGHRQDECLGDVLGRGIDHFLLRPRPGNSHHRPGGRDDMALARADDFGLAPIRAVYVLTTASLRR
jgi:hypothetical protein